VALRVACPPGGAGARPIVLQPQDDRVSADRDPARILIVEDDYLAAADTESGLTEAGFQVVGIAATAGEAIGLARSERPELIIMDIRLAGVRDGVEAALEIFRDCGIRCVFATAHHDAQVRARARPAEPLGWLPKPYTSYALIATVRSALAQLRQSS
jgi:DNA-binding NarL/FixJ family response regulator